MAALKPNAIAVFNYVRDNDGADITAADIAEALSLEVKSVNGTVTSAFQKKGLMVREEGEVELADGTHKKVKFIRLTDAGREFDPEAQA